MSLPAVPRRYQHRGKEAAAFGPTPGEGEALREEVKRLKQEERCLHGW